VSELREDNKMTLFPAVPLNSVQRANRQKYGSAVTLLGTGGFTATANFTDNVTAYQPAAGNIGKVKGSFSVQAMGLNTIIGIRVRDQSRAVDTRIASAIAAGQAEKFETVLTDDDIVSFFGDNAANDGSLDCEIEIEETPA